MWVARVLQGVSCAAGMNTHVVETLGRVCVVVGCWEGCVCGTEVTVWCVLLLVVLFLHASAHAVLLAKAFCSR